MSADEHIAILIPTYRRPDALALALDSALDQEVEGFSPLVYVIDNDSEQSARHVVESRERVTYVPEPRSGVSHARNTGLAATRARYVFFLDDDMLAEPGCVAELLRGLKAHGAAVAFASVHARMPTRDALQAAMQPFFSRAPDLAEGLVDKGMGAGGSLLDRTLCDFPSPVFDPALNATGGEDDRLFAHLALRGARFAWVPTARTIEIVPAHRATLDYVWKRNFAFGQGPTQLAHDSVRNGRARGWLGIAKWMLVGSVQTALRLPAWSATMLLRSPTRATAHANLAQALGKIFWWDGFRQPLYGATATDRP